MSARQKSIADVLHDHKLWHEIRGRVVEAVTPLFLELYLGGAHGAVKVLARSGLKPPARRGKKSAASDWVPFLEDPAFAAKAAQYVSIYAIDWWNRLEGTVRAELQQVIMGAIDSGQSVADTIAEVADLFGPARAARIAITETTRLFGAGAQATYAAVGVQSWEWRTAEDADVDPICEDLRDGSPYPMDTPFEPAHVNCLLPGTRCSEATVLAATARRYEGQAIILRTAGGHELSVTTNHPILTPEGWCAAGELREGNDVICQISERMAPLVDPNDVEMPSIIEQVTGALLEAGGSIVFGVPTAAEDFHGDGVPHGEVNVVSAARLLWSDRNVARAEEGGEHDLIVAGLRERPLQRGGGAASLDLRGNAAGRSGVGGGVLRAAFLPTHALPLDEFGGGLIANGDASLEEPAPDRPAVHTEHLGDGVLRISGLVSKDDRGDVEWLSVVGRPDRLISVEAIRYSGHVYNLQTVRGCYGANGIIAGNCRCWPVPVEA